MKPSCFLHPDAARRGSVLVVVLWASVGLVSVALLFGHSMLMAYRGVDNEVAGRQADAAIEGAIRYVESLLESATTPGMFPDPTSYESEAVPIGEATFWLLGRAEDPVNNSTQEYGIVDEAAKLNLNQTAPNPGAHINVGALQDLPGMTPELATQFTEWCDPNGAGTGGGGISATTVKHAAFESVEELALIEGMTREILLGGDANLNGVPDSAESTAGSSTLATSQTEPGLIDYFTTFSREPNTRSDTGDARVELATPQSPEMAALLAEKFDPTTVTRILAAFQSGPPTSALDFYIRSGITAEEFGEIVDLLTTEPVATPFIIGRINVNTASAAVLACVPTLDATLAAALVAARISNPPTDTNIAWVVAAIGPAAATAAGPHLTGQSWQVSVDVAAVGRHGRGYRRTRAVIDMSDSAKGPRIVYRRDLSPLGWALGSQVRQQLALNKEAR